MDAEPNRPSANSLDAVVPDIAALRRITAEQLRRLGKRQIAYLRTSLQPGDAACILVRADGVAIAMMESTECAARAAMHLSLNLAAVH